MCAVDLTDSKKEGSPSTCSSLPCTTYELFNDWGERGYDDSVHGQVTKTASSGNRTT